MKGRENIIKGAAPTGCGEKYIGSGQRYLKKGMGNCLQLLFPRRCPVCDEIVGTWGEKICIPCLKKLKYVAPPYCMKCGKPVEEGQEYCKDCNRYPHLFVCGRALYEYKSVAPGIYRFKYGGRREYADFWGEELALYLGGFIHATGAQALIPVPLHPRRRRKRGYNQAQALANVVGRLTGVPVYRNYVSRIRDTAPLKALTPWERQNNLKKAFIIKQNDVKLKKVIIVDDVYTTGNTMDAVSKVLVAAGVQEIYCVALACGVGL